MSTAQPTEVSKLPDSVTERIDRLFAEWDRPDSPGAALAVVQDGEVVYSRGYGMANLEEDVPITPASVFYLASVSKQFVAFCTAILATEGVISLDDPLQRWFPEFPEYEQPVTIRQMVHHTSGLRDKWSVFRLGGWRDDDVFTEADALEMLSRQRGLNFPPGSDYSYSNSGYALQALLVKRATGKSLREFAQERLFGPLGMTSTLFRDQRHLVVKRRAQAYRKVGDQFLIDMPNFDLVGGGGLYSSAEDLARWLKNFETRQVGSPEVFGLILAPGPAVTGTPYGYMFGLMGRIYRGLTVVEHSGGMTGYRTETWRVPERRFGVICLANLDSVNSWGLARRITDLCLFGDDSQANRTTPSNEPVPANLAGIYRDAQTGQYLFLSVEDGQLKQGIDAPNPLPDLGGLRFLMDDEEGMFLQADPENPDRLEIDQEFWGKPPLVYERVEPVTLGEGELAQYAGTWYSDELLTSCQTVVQDGKLVYRQRKHDDQLLVPTGSDRFASDSIRLSFSRDQVGLADRFEIGTGRAWGIEFVRQDA